MKRMKSVRHYISGELRGQRRSISPMFNTAGQALEWLKKQQTSPAFVEGWKGGSFELVSVFNTYERRPIE